MRYVVEILDSGSELNLIRLNKILDRNEIDTTLTCVLKGIESRLNRTLGKITIDIEKCACDIHVILQDFSIIQDGILGIKFL